MSNKQQSQISQWFQAAHAEGILSAQGLQSLSIVDLGAQIQAGLGVSVDDVPASEVTLVSIMPDDSGSIRFSGNSDVVREGHNQVLDALMATRNRDSILAHTRYLSGLVLYPFRPVDQAVRMTPQNYNPNQGTPLYDETVVLLGTVLAKAQDFANSGVAVRTITLIITDGSDQHSRRSRVEDVAALVRDMQRAESHIVAAMGIDDGSTPFRKVFREMGIEDRWILTPRNNMSEIRAAFQLFSQSAIRASQSGAHFSKTALGGFGS